MLAVQSTAPHGALLDAASIRQTLETGLAGKYTGAKVLVLIPDHTRTLPLPQLFRDMVEVLHDTRQLDFMIALGTHPAPEPTEYHQLIGITAEERATTFKHIGLLNHAWDDPDALLHIGTLTQEQIKGLAGDAWHESLGGDVPVRINRAIMDYDQIIILGPTFPHEVVGFSGGAKYLFPGISGPEMINMTHWLGALITILDTIGIRDTPMRAALHAAAEFIPTPITLVSMVVEQGGLAGLFIGDHVSAWQAAVELSAQKHITWVDKPFQRVLSCAPPMYGELWTGAKAMYKLEPAIADGGEIIVYAPHLEVVSHVHGAGLYEAGYHVRDFFLNQWAKYQHIPAGVLAHSTHLRGSGTYENGIERARIQVTLASKISAADCAQLALGYCDPQTIDPAEWQGREDEGILYVPKAGEMLYRLKTN